MYFPQHGSDVLLTSHMDPCDVLGEIVGFVKGTRTLGTLDFTQVLMVTQVSGKLCPAHTHTCYTYKKQPGVLAMIGV